MNNLQVDGNKEMIAFGFMNIIGSFTSCYLTTGIYNTRIIKLYNQNNKYFDFKKNVLHIFISPEKTK